jgi:DNA-directed RNA polymerase specialized sigma24 family protein
MQSQTIGEPDGSCLAGLTHRVDGRVPFRRSSTGTEQADTQRILRSLVHRLTQDWALEEDLFQEALLHLWRSQEGRPGQTQSWYLQSCLFHLRDCLARGRSLDSFKHLGARLRSVVNEDDFEEICEPAEPEAGPWDEVASKDDLGVLTRWLEPQERAVLEALVEGLSARQAARRFGISHTLVLKLRQRIAATAVRLGIYPHTVRPAADGRRTARPGAAGSTAPRPSAGSIQWEPPSSP